jgi:tRNA(Ile)-lysidine synthase
MLQKVKRYIEYYGMIQPGDKVVLGFSGGADSVALLHVLRELQEPLQFQLFAAHVNHGLRGQAALDDAKFAEDICKSWGISFFLKEVDIRALAKEKQQSEEEAGRVVRYGFFKEIMDRIKGNKIATAHHKNDQAETILHNIIRGTGMQGLTGIKPFRNGVIIRPFLDVARQEIEDYLEKQQIPFRTDATNADSIYTRNRIRNQLLPDLAQNYNPDIVDSLARMGDILREEDNFLISYCKNLYEEMVSYAPKQVELDLRKFNNCHPAVKRRLVRLAVEDIRGDLDGVGHSHVEAVIRLAECSQTGSRTIIPAGSLNKRRIAALIGYSYLVFRVENGEEPITDFEKVLPVPGKLTLEELDLSITSLIWDKSKGFSFSPWCIYIDKDKLKGSLSLRLRRDGDRFKPLGMEGSKKLKDYFIDNKVPRDKRSRIPLLVDRENIIWVVGYQINHDYRITDTTTNIIRISAEQHKTDGG